MTTTTPAPNQTITLSSNGAKDDPNVRIPAAVKRSATHAEQLHAQSYSKSGNPEVAGQPVAPEGASPTPAGDQPVAPQPISPAGDWEQKFRSVNGRYTQSTQTIQNLTSRINDLEAALADRDARLSAAPAPAKPAQSLLTEEEISDYGPEFLEVVGKKAREIAASEISRLENVIQNLQAKINNVGTNVSQNARDKMKSELDAKIPNWREINNNPDFMVWLGLNDPYSGQNRYQMLIDAWNNNDTRRVHAFFNGFITDDATTAPQNNGQPVPATPGVTKPPLERFAAPGRASTGDAMSPAPSKPIITRAKITAFHRDVAQGKYDDRPAERKAFDIAMVEAAREGRIA